MVLDLSFEEGSATYVDRSPIVVTLPVGVAWLWSWPLRQQEDMPTPVDMLGYLVLIGDENRRLALICSIWGC